MEDAKIILQNFTRTTSCHGIPQVGYSRNVKHKFLWMIVFGICLIVFVTQATLLINKFVRGDKTVRVELKFEAAPFPAVTICNLNPYKNSLVQQVRVIQDTLNVFDHVKKSTTTHYATEKPVIPPRRRTRQISYQPILTFCNCDNNTNGACVPITNPVGPFGSRCVCFRDLEYEMLEACSSEKMWTTVTCYDCSYTGRCARPTQRANDERPERECMCPATADYCVIKPNDLPVIGDPAWFTSTSSTTSTSSPSTTSSSTTSSSTTTSPTTTTTTPTTTIPYTGSTTVDYKDIQALGFEGMTDEVAIVTKAKENLVFIIATLDMETRINLSYTKHEFVRMCSFNGKQCDIDNEFGLHLDPTYGNCYTFNFNPASNLTSSRAGPMYGLRVLAYSNLTDYMPTTESAGVRIQVHGQNDQPFPDTFGQNAPTGFISSFGIQLKEITRSPTSRTCAVDGRTDKYIYYNKTYSTEGCYRSCFQQLLLEKCSCADPRFPKPENAVYCEAKNAESRGCLNNVTEAGGFHQVQAECDCRQPCKQSGYAVSYSAARWPADFFRMGECENENETCVQEYRKNAVLLEIYYEQLNYESLEELEAYVLVNLVADFGGQLGLWLGFSIITCVEILMLAWQLVSIFCGHQPDRVQWDSKANTALTDDNMRRLRVGMTHKTTLNASKDLIQGQNRKHQRSNNEYCTCHESEAKVNTRARLAPSESEDQSQSLSITARCNVEN